MDKLCCVMSNDGLVVVGFGALVNPDTAQTSGNGGGGNDDNNDDDQPTAASQR